MISLRPYQSESKQAVLDYWAAGGGSPLVDLATGLGKSVVIASLVRELAEGYPAMRILMLVHSRDLVAQNFAALVRAWPQAPAGIYSAGLGRRDAHHRITFAGIQSVYRKAEELGPRDLILIDEAHLVPNEGTGMYRTLLDGLREMRPDLRVCGFTATPFRMDSGRLDQGKERLFDEVVYSFGIGRGVDDGWLTPLVAKNGDVEIDVSGVAKRGGEFVSGALEAAADTDEITRAAVAEFTQLGAARRSWLIFCAGVKHAHHVRDAVRAAGVSCEVITGDTPGAERDRILDDLRSGKLKAVTNANCLTTGLDVPGIDMIVLLRPTLSKGLYVQIAGRGTRLFDGKKDCLFLDYTGTCRRMGPVDAIEVAPKRQKGEPDEDAKVKVDQVRAKECPKCQTLAGLSARLCKVCGHEWPVTAVHEREADTTPILSRDLKHGPEEIPLLSWSCKRHVKVGSPDSLRVDYLAGVQTYRKWLAFDHGGYGRDKAQRWWLKHGPGPAPESVESAIVRWCELTKPSHITVKPEGKWWDVTSQRFSDTEERAA